MFNFYITITLMQLSSIEVEIAYANFTYPEFECKVHKDI